MKNYIFYAGVFMFFLGAALSLIWEFGLIGKKDSVRIPIIGCIFLTIGITLMKIYNIL